jgi:hypothetical protein
MEYKKLARIRRNNKEQYGRMSLDYLKTYLDQKKEKANKEPEQFKIEQEEEEEVHLKIPKNTNQSLVQRPLTLMEISNLQRTSSDDEEEEWSWELELKRKFKRDEKKNKKKIKFPRRIPIEFLK